MAAKPVFAVEAGTVRHMIAELDRRFPGLGNQIDEGCPSRSTAKSTRTLDRRRSDPNSEIVLVPKIGGG